MQCEQERGAVCEKKERTANAGKRERATRSKNGTTQKMSREDTYKITRFLGLGSLFVVFVRRGGFVVIVVFVLARETPERERERAALIRCFNALQLLC